ncbi:hypothetical protein BBO99_00002880 [Phytophthora kernoviae]|uniref:Uncharacterized protein n=2 Tax=Phytophthora kernoviae TaxID=325452 RepID=A0A3F2RTU1_9STRA|nr:hypothetical protein G195_009555 [Phytophthora kernoviae 00238/432]KAG2512900.1 hypothetical protein JM16_008025 [Phytophthora kernoviae]KAG2527416.1 hypothetical protein JM18_003122 [Phytophthora kernoviae]RLN14312.1 hypothetical protein BBI17_002795 [Phytophthora kernoviae]RLN64020.1 hypothetical protein BBP00_00003729 [Phytophthora kernoviae]
MATPIEQLPQVPPPGTSPRSSTSWSRCDQAVARVAPIATTTCQCSKTLQGSGLSDVLETVQSEMSPAQKKEFQLACQKVAAV